MLEYRERNGNKHIVSDNELNAFAWAGYYANYSTILINGKNYEVVIVARQKLKLFITDSIIKSIVSLNVNVEHMYKDIVQIHY